MLTKVLAGLGFACGLLALFGVKVGGAGPLDLVAIGVMAVAAAVLL